MRPTSSEPPKRPEYKRLRSLVSGPGWAPILLRMLVPIGLVAALVAVVDGDELGAILAATDWRPVAVALVLVQVQILASAWRWRYTAGRLGVAIGYRRAVGEYYLAGLLNMVLPGGVAGDVVRTVRSTRDGTSTRAAVRSVVLERLSGQIAFWAIAVAGIGAWALAGTRSAPEGWGLVILALPVALLACAATVAAARRLWPARIGAALADLGPDIGRAFLSDGALVVQVAVSLSIAASYVAVFALAGLAIGAPLPWTGVATLIPLTLLSMLLPVSIGGWGLREGTAALLWPLAGLTAAAGVATAVLYGAIVLAGALPGLMVLLRRRRAPQPAAPAGPVPDGVASTSLA